MNWKYLLSFSYSIIMKAKRRIGHHVKLFINDSRSVGIVLLVSTTASLVISNFWLGNKWLNFWETEMPFFHRLQIPHSYLHIINDGLMAVFFMLAGMEIKRELLDGELSSAQKAALPATAALGGMLIPALIFSFFNKGSDAMSGWAIPASTDIAFSLGVASLLGNRVPVSLKIFLTALAIIDDLGAIVIIACFYGDPVKLWFLLAALIVIGGILFFNRRLKKFGLIQFILGILLWWLVYHSGIHATVAGVIFAFLVPRSMLSKLEHWLHRPVYFIIMPLFALANTAILFPDDLDGSLMTNLSWGIILGLFIGKPLGIYLSAYFLVKQKKAVLPNGVNWPQLLGAGILAGIGFTMSIFISSLAFKEKGSIDTAKIAVLAGSFLSMIGGYFCLKYFSGKPVTTMDEEDPERMRDIE